jgi:hypothetical protein
MGIFRRIRAATANIFGFGRREAERAKSGPAKAALARRLDTAASARADIEQRRAAAGGVAERVAADRAAQQQQINREVVERAEWHPVSSSWVSAIRFVGENTLDVQYHDKRGAPTVICRYNQPVQRFKDMLASPSKGKFVHRYLYRLPYTIIGRG